MNTYIFLNKGNTNRPFNVLITENTLDDAIKGLAKFELSNLDEIDFQTVSKYSIEDAMSKLKVNETDELKYGQLVNIVHPDGKYEHVELPLEEFKSKLIDAKKAYIKGVLADLIEAKYQTITKVIESKFEEGSCLISHFKARLQNTTKFSTPIFRGMVMEYKFFNPDLTFTEIIQSEYLLDFKNVYLMELEDVHREITVFMDTDAETFNVLIMSYPLNIVTF